jgi:hypothetical protein
MAVERLDQTLTLPFERVPETDHVRALVTLYQTGRWAPHRIGEIGLKFFGRGAASFCQSEDCCLLTPRSERV